MTLPREPFQAPTPPSLEAGERRWLSRLAFSSIASWTGKTSEGPELPDSGVLGEPHGVFVTLRIGERLRGCIGTAIPRTSLAESVVEYSQAAASRDTRFPPLTASELDEISVEISVLSRLADLRGQPGDVVEVLRPGVHGLYLVVGDRRGLLLPQVASRYALTAEEFLESTAEKAGLEPGGWMHPEARLSVFTAESFMASRP